MTGFFFHAYRRMMLSLLALMKDTLVSSHFASVSSKSQSSSSVVSTSPVVCKRDDTSTD